MGPDMQKSRLASAQGFAGGSLVDHVLIDQLLHQYANGAPRDLHATRQVGARNRLVLADQIKRDAPIDVARRGARGYFEISRVNLTHAFQRLLFEVGTI